jgi:hypothetical protein
VGTGRKTQRTEIVVGNEISAVVTTDWVALQVSLRTALAGGLKETL